MPFVIRMEVVRCPMRVTVSPFWEEHERTGLSGPLMQLVCMVLIFELVVPVGDEGLVSFEGGEVWRELGAEKFVGVDELDAFTVGFFEAMVAVDDIEAAVADFGLDDRSAELDVRHVVFMDYASEMVAVPVFNVYLLLDGHKVAGFDVLEHLCDIEDKDAVGEELVADSFLAWNEVGVEEHVPSVEWLTWLAHGLIMRVRSGNVR